MIQFNKKQVAFVLIFAVLGFLALQVPVATIAGSKAHFTLFDAFAPVAGGFLGSFPGVVAVFLMQAVNFIVDGVQIQDMAPFIRFITPLFATLYFAKKRKWMLLIPLAAIVAFIAHPIGRTVWYFSLYWLVPVVCYFFHNRSLLARSFGATFTAHAVGGALWIYFFNLPAAVWAGLVPVVAIERTLFAGGIALSTIILTNVIALLDRKGIISVRTLHTEKKYTLPQLRSHSAK